MIRATLLAFALPPVLLLLAVILASIQAARGQRRAGVIAALAAFAVLLLATPAVAGLLAWSLERELATEPRPGFEARAIIVLGGDVHHGPESAAVGRITLMRLRAGAALHRSTGLPLLVTGGALSVGDPPLAILMARSLADDFGTPAQWIEPRAADTRENAQFSTAILAGSGLAQAYLVTHAWHLPRALEAFARAGLEVAPVPVEARAAANPALSDWLPRPDHLMHSWYAMREWAGRLVYAIRG